MNETQGRKLIWLGLRVIGNLLACVAILATSVAAIVWINRTEPVAEKIKATRKSAALVETVTVHRGDFAPKLSVLGTVQAAQQIVLSPRVGGQIVEIASELIPGGMTRRGDVLVTIDPADFQNALSVAKSELQQAKASFDIEQGRQTLAKKELALLEGTIGDTNRALVLRQPQIASIRAEVSAAVAAVERAQLDLERTEVRAPFDAQVLSREINVGSQVSPGDELAQLVGIEEYWVTAAVPVRSLQWIQFPQMDNASREHSSDANREGSRVILRNPDSWPAGTERTGRVTRMIGSLDQQTRLARVLISVEDPLGRDSDAPPLILDTLIETEIEGQPIEEVVRVERTLIRDGETIWVMKAGQLEIRKVEIVFRDAEYAYISHGVDDGEEVVVTTLSTVAEGVDLRKIGADARPSAEESTR